jgi:hypothetical protein
MPHSLVEGKLTPIPPARIGPGTFGFFYFFYFFAAGRSQISKSPT